MNRLQVLMLMHRFGLTPEQAAAIALLVFGGAQ